MENPIPEDQLARVRPIVDRVLADLRVLTRALPDETDSALTYEPSEDGK